VKTTFMEILGGPLRFFSILVSCKSEYFHARFQSSLHIY
jgi:hypothetical protein